MRLDFIAIWLDAIGNTFTGRGKKEVNIDQCLNCQHPVTADLSYCPNCGQKLRFSYITIWTLLGDFFSDLLNLDNTIFRSLKMLIVPGYLAKEYMEGRRKKYLNPIRFFFVTLVILFSVLSFVLDFDFLDFVVEENAKQIGMSEFKHDYTAWRDTLPDDLKTSDVLDSMEIALLANYKDVETDTSSYNLQMFGVDMRDYSFLRKDLFEENIDTLLNKYEVEKFWDRLVVSQYARAMRNPGGAVQFFIGNMLWGIVSTIFILSLFMKLLYIRRNRFYVEHAMVLFTIHTFTFLVLIIVNLVMENVSTDYEDIPALSGGIAIILYAFLSIKRYYGQGFIKTALKFAMMFFFYFIIILLMIFVVVTASLLLYK